MSAAAAADHETGGKLTQLHAKLGGDAANGVPRLDDVRVANGCKRWSRGGVLPRGSTAASAPRPAQAQRQLQRTRRRVNGCQAQREGQQQAGEAGHCWTR